MACFGAEVTGQALNLAHASPQGPPHTNLSYPQPIGEWLLPTNVPGNQFIWEHIYPMRRETRVLPQIGLRTSRPLLASLVPRS